MTGSAATRSNMRSSGRMPPFIFIGLLVLVGFLGYEYWSYHSENNELRNEIEKVRVESRDFDQKRSESEKNLELSREELGRAKVDREGIQKQLQEKEAELNNVKSEFTKKQTQAEEIQKTLATCDENLQARVAEVDKIKAENGELTKSLEAEKTKLHVCDLNSCVDPVKQVIDIVSRIIGTEQVGKALSEAKLDAATLMNGIPLYSGQQQQQVPQNQQPPQKLDQNQNQNVNTMNNGNVKVKEMSMGNVDDANKVVHSKQSDSLVFQSDKENATAKTDQAQKLEKDENYDASDTPSPLSQEKRGENNIVGDNDVKESDENVDNKKKEELDKDTVATQSEGDRNVDETVDNKKKEGLDKDTVATQLEGDRNVDETVENKKKEELDKDTVAIHSEGDRHVDVHQEKGGSLALR